MQYTNRSAITRSADSSYQVPTISSRLAHDLQAPLRRISQFSVILREDYCESLDGDGKHFIDVIDRSVGELSSLVDGLLACSMASNESFQRESIGLNQLITEITEELKSDIDYCAAQIDVHRLPTVFGDRNFVFSLFFQLLKNAMMFRREGVKPRICVKGFFDYQSHSLIVSVSDNGRGIPAALKSSLFNALEKGDASIGEQGNGLGLYLARVICERHGWSIVVNETTEAATELFVFIPAAGVDKSLLSFPTADVSSG